MTNQDRSPSKELLAARRALESMEGITLLRDWTWNAVVNKWVLHGRLSPDISVEGQVPTTTEWYVLVDPAYPWGSITFYPSKKGSIVQTFPHQSFNSNGPKEVPWRNGDICLDTTVRVLGRRGYDTEPYGVHQRLQWRFQRALDWLTAASHGELNLSGEPFELPVFPVQGSSITAVFCEGTDTFAAWRDVEECVGLVDLASFSTGRDFLLVRRFWTCDGRELLAPNWGLAIQNTSEEPLLGIWLRIKDVPILHPWQAPITWGELRQACNVQSVDIDALLKAAARFIRDGKKHIALLGFPIPARVGDSPCQMHWQPFMIPVLARGSQIAKGFRPNERGYWQHDRIETLRGDVSVDWLASENWHAEQISTRGKLSETLISRKVLLLGVGAVGSALAELLVRAGLSSLTIMDGDRLKTGNLVRHTLGLEQTGSRKASAVADWLNQLLPFASVRAIDTNFPPATETDAFSIQECEIVLDCTARDEVLHDLETFPWQEPRLFFSISLGLQAKRLFVFTAYSDRFPHSEFDRLIAPWLVKEIGEHGGEEWPREGVGCWHPIFPARVDDVRMLASIALKQIEFRAKEIPSEPELLVFEQRYKDGRLVNVSQAYLQTDDE